jgi:hypothetical protein
LMARRLVEARDGQRRPGVVQELRQPASAFFQRPTAQILAVELDEVERALDRLRLDLRSAPQQLEDRQADGIADNDLVVDRAEARLERADCRDDTRIALRPVVGVAGPQTEANWNSCYRLRVTNSPPRKGTLLIRASWRSARSGFQHDAFEPFRRRAASSRR